MPDEPAPDIFLSYSTEDHEKARRFVEIFEEHHAWSVFWDREIEPGRDWESVLQQKLEEASCVVVLWSSNARDSKWVPGEARRAQKTGPVLPVKIETVDLPLSLERLQAVDLSDWDGTIPNHRLARLTGAIRKLLATQKAEVEPPVDESPESKPATLIWNLPPRNRLFQGRRDLLERLATRLRAHPATALTQTISGLGGIGKTQTAIEYCYRHGEDYEAIFWCNAESAESLAADYLAAARDLQLATDGTAVEDGIRLFRAHLAGLETPWLVVLDNADEPEDVAHLRPDGARGHVLITSRSSNLAVFGASPADGLGVEVLDEIAAVALLASAEGDEQAARELAGELGYLPLALEQARAYLAADPLLDLADYLALFRESRLEALAWPEAGDYGTELTATWELSFQRVKDISPAAAEVLQGLGFLAPDDIPIELVVEGLEHFGPASREIAAQYGEPSARRREILAPLLRYSLIKIHKDSDGPGLLSIHRLVQAAITRRLDSKEVEESAWLRVHRALEAAAPPGDVKSVETWPGWRRLSLHIRAHSRSLAESSTADPANLWFRAGWYAWSAGSHLECQDHFEATLRLRRRVLGDEHHDTLQAMGNLAATLGGRGKFSEARSLEEQVLELRRRAFGDEHPSTLSTMSNIAVTLWDQGKLSEARALGEQVLEVRRRVLGDEHPNTLVSMGNLAAVLRDQGELSEARSLEEQVLEMRRRVLGDEHPDTLLSIGNLASTLRRQGNLIDARLLGQQALALHRRALGDEHPQTLMAMGNFAAVLGDQGEWSRARSIGENVLELRRRVLGDEHPQTLWAMASLINTLRDLEDKDSMESLAEELVDAVSRVELPKNHQAHRVLRKLGLEDEDS